MKAHKAVSRVCARRVFVRPRWKNTTPIYLSCQFELDDNDMFANLSTPFLILYRTCGVNSVWPLQYGYDSTGSLANAKFEYIGITTNSLHAKANPICLAVVNEHCTIAHEHTYESMEACVFHLVQRLHLC